MENIKIDEAFAYHTQFINGDLARVKTMLSFSIDDEDTINIKITKHLKELETQQVINIKVVCYTNDKLLTAPYINRNPYDIATVKIIEHYKLEAKSNTITALFNHNFTNQFLNVLMTREINHTYFKISREIANRQVVEIHYNNHTTLSSFLENEAIRTILLKGME